MHLHLHLVTYPQHLHQRQLHHHQLSLQLPGIILLISAKASILRSVTKLYLSDTTSFLLRVPSVLASSAIATSSLQAKSPAKPALMNTKKSTASSSTSSRFSVFPLHARASALSIPVPAPLTEQQV